MSRVVALAAMRLRAYVVSQRAWAPWLASLALVLVAHGGGAARPAPAYAFSATLLFAAFCWQTKLVLDTEPDTQRMLARLGVGSARRELVAGLLAAALAAVPAIVAGVLVPLVIGALELPGGGATVQWLVFGLWVHVLAAVCGLGVGALASRAVIRPAGWAALVLVGVPVVVMVFGSRDSALLRWLVPQLFAVAHIDSATDVLATAAVTGHALGWTAVTLTVYAALRRSRP